MKLQKRFIYPIYKKIGNGSYAVPYSKGVLIIL